MTTRQISRINKQFIVYHKYRASPKKCNPPLFQIFLQNSFSNINNDFMVEENNILEIVVVSSKSDHT